ncbi:MAG: hypothetical protein LBV71_14565 [Prevotella sp.]|nr:hypothetical protein [Prevotella sp.]
MRKYLFIVLAMLSVTTVMNAQNVVKRVVENTNKGDSKKHYNYLLLDAVNYSDAVYSEYEKKVQDVWDKKISADLRKGKTEAFKEIDKYLDIVKTTPIYKGGEEYQLAVLTYINSVKAKVEALENLGILGDDPNADAIEYNNASIKFTDVSNQTIDLRNIVRDKKSTYEKTFYIE